MRWNPVTTLLLLALPLMALARPESTQITLDYVAEKAEQRAHKPFRSPRADLPAILRQENLDYDKYREIEFRHDKALWLSDELPYRVEFFHPGYLYQEPVRINEFTSSHIQQIRFAQEFYNYHSLDKIERQIPSKTGYAGFRLLHPLNVTNKFDEIGSFLGASYFRLLGKGQRYGLSARGLAVDCGETDRPEEFPIFTDWWLGKPQKDDTQIRLFAILDSVSCVGAYEFLIRPGESTVADVEAVLYFRETNNVVAAGQRKNTFRTVGFAPLTSMFWFGKGSQRKFSDYRPEVHDSDGVLMHMENGEMLWRPLSNPSAMQHQRFATKNIRGFGLMQRERDFAAYQDMFNHYHLTPSVWVQPHGNWGEGEVHIVELSTHYEGLDNIVAFWNPRNQPQPMQPYRYGYTLYWTLENDKKFSVNKVIATRAGVDSRDPKRQEFVLDFDGPQLAAIPEAKPPRAIANCSDNAVLNENQIFFNPMTKNWRVVLKLTPKAENKEPVDIRCTLQNGNEVASETWTYHWSRP